MGNRTGARPRKGPSPRLTQSLHTLTSTPALAQACPSGADPALPSPRAGRGSPSVAEVSLSSLTRPPPAGHEPRGAQPRLRPAIALWALLAAARSALMVAPEPGGPSLWALQLPLLLGGGLAIVLGARGHRQAAVLTALLGTLATALPQTVFGGGMHSAYAAELWLTGFVAAMMLRRRWAVGLLAAPVGLTLAELLSGGALLPPPMWSPSRWQAAFFAFEAISVAIFVGAYRSSELTTAAQGADELAAALRAASGELRQVRARELERTHHQAMIARLAREALAPEAQRRKTAMLHPGQLDVEVGNVLRELCTGAARTLSVPGCMVVCPGPERRWPVVAAYGPRTEALDELGLSELLDVFFASQQPLSPPEIEGQPASLAALGLQISHITPIRGSDQPWGLLLVFQGSEASPLSSQARFLLHNVAQLASAVLINASVNEALRQKELQLARAQRMEPIGMLAGGIAHDFNNYMQVVLMYTGALKESLSERPEDLADLSEIETAAHRAAAVAKLILDYGRRREPCRRVLDLNELVATVSSGFRKLIGEHIEIELHPSPTPALAQIDPDEFNQVLLNLVVNARDAMPRGGTLRLRVQTDSSARQARLIVQDSGAGMSPETLARIFEPFFTTKGEDRGTGLGLSMVDSLVRGWGGTVQARSTLGVGTEFEISLGLQRCPQVEAAEGARPTPGAARPGGGPTILVVEDDPAVRAAVTETLRLGGYRTLEAGDCVEALRLAAGGDVRLLLTDVMLPGMTGMELFSTMKGSSACLSVLYMTGYSAAELARSARSGAAPPSEVLTKPFRASTLLTHIEQQLMQQPSAH